MVGASLTVRDHDSNKMRRELVFRFLDLKTGDGGDEVVSTTERLGGIISNFRRPAFRQSLRFWLEKVCPHIPSHEIDIRGAHICVKSPQLTKTNKDSKSEE